MKSIARVVTALAAFLVITACGPETSQPTPTATTGAAQPTATSPAAKATAAPTGTAGTAAPAPATATQPPPTEAPQPLVLHGATIETNPQTSQGALADKHTINLPAGFHIRVYAAGVSGVRWLGYSPDGLLYATSPSTGQVMTLPDANKDGVADSVKVFADNLPGVHGIAFKDGAVYVATETEIVRLQDTKNSGVADKRDVLANDLPGGGGHATRTLAFGPDGKLYVSVGSSCNVCVEQDPKRAAISRYSADGKFEEVFAKGLRNVVGIVFQPITGELWATNNGRDGLGDNVPPETIYSVKEGANYGWPFCYGTRTPDQTQNVPAGYCEKTDVPAVEMQAHSAPLGLAFYEASQFPADYKGDLFVAFHGSWNRSVPTGYKFVRIRFKDNQPDKSAGNAMVEDFATGWLLDGSAWGRPVDTLVAPDGSLLLTDDKAGAVYDIYYKP